MNNSPCDFSDARREIPSVTTNFQWCNMDNSLRDFSDARRKNPGVTTSLVMEDE